MGQQSGLKPLVNADKNMGMLYSARLVLCKRTLFICRAIFEWRSKILRETRFRYGMVVFHGSLRFIEATKQAIAIFETHDPFLAREFSQLNISFWLMPGQTSEAGNYYSIEGESVDCILGRIVSISFIARALGQEMICGDVKNEHQNSVFEEKLPAIYREVDDWLSQVRSKPL